MFILGTEVKTIFLIKWSANAILVVASRLLGYLWLHSNCNCGYLSAISCNVDDCSETSFFRFILCVEKICLEFRQYTLNYDLINSGEWSLVA